MQLTITQRQLPAKFSVHRTQNPQRFAIVCSGIISGVIYSLCMGNVRTVIAQNEKIVLRERYRTRLHYIFYVGTRLFAERLALNLFLWNIDRSELTYK